MCVCVVGDQISKSMDGWMENAQYSIKTTTAIIVVSEQERDLREGEETERDARNTEALPHLHFVFF